MSAINYFNPFHTGFEQAGINFHQLKVWQKAVAVIASIAAGILTFAIGSIPVFRWTVEKFSKGDDQKADAVDKAARQILQTDEYASIDLSASQVFEEQENDDSCIDLSASVIFGANGEVISGGSLLSVNDQPSDFDVDLSKETTPAGPREVKESVAEIEFIRNFVSSFLHPYITGQITEKTDSKDRKPMIELLLEKMPGLEPSRRDEIQEMALNAFFKKSALGLYVNLMRVDDITSESSEFEILVNALTKAIPREFPKREISAQELREKASAALDVVNEERARIKKESWYESNPTFDLKSLKEKILSDSGKIFLDSSPTAPRGND